MGNKKIKNKIGNFRKNQSGFIQIILTIVFTLVLLKYAYDVDVVGYLTSGIFKTILDRFYEFGSEGWGKYSEFIKSVWNFVIDLVKGLLDKIKS